MSNLKENINKELLKRGWSVSRLATESRVPQPTLQRYLSGTHSEPRSGTIQKIAHGFGITEGELRGLTNPPIVISNAEFIGGFEEWDNDTPLRDDEVELPFFKEVELSAGSGKYHIEENYGGKLRFSKQALKSHGVAIHAAACVKVSGNSMEPVFPNGCTVGIDTANTAIKDGEIYAINYNGRLLIKAIYRVPTGGIRLKSFNTEEWPDEPVTEDKMELLKILGRVFWCSWLR
jgi:phage repressor protein C with HTH and peptisase S24 domain